MPAKQFQGHIERIIHHDQVRLMQRKEGCFNIRKSKYHTTLREQKGKNL